MSVHKEDEDPEYQTVGVDAQELERYGAFSTDDDELVIYDKSVEDAWIQSEAVIELDSVA